MTHTIDIQNQHFILHSSGAIYWQEQAMLLVSDVHLGKVAHFRKHGFAIPNEAIFENFNRLTEVVGFFKPKLIVFLGDLFHSNLNIEWDFFALWRQALSQKVILIEGNHDILDPKYYADLDIECHEAMLVDGFLLTHQPKETAGFFNFCGHIHPGIKLLDIGRKALYLPCFFHKPNQLILPAFGEFTGNYYLKPSENDKVYVIANEQVIPV